MACWAAMQGELPPQEQMRMGGSHGFLPYHTTATLMAAAISDLPASEVSACLLRPVHAFFFCLVEDDLLTLPAAFQTQSYAPISA